MIGVSYSFVGPVEDPKLIHMVMIAQFWPTNHHPDDEGRVFTIYNLHFTFLHMMFIEYYLKFTNHCVKLINNSLHKLRIQINEIIVSYEVFWKR